MDQEEQENLLRRLEGLHTVETAAEALHLQKQSALNLLSRLKREGYITVSGGGKLKRLYKITMRKQRPRVPGMWDVLNKYNPNFQLNPWYDHQVHGSYGPEEALVDAVQFESFRILLACLKVFNHITDWPKLYRLAREKNCWQKIGALYDVARLFMKVRKMPERYQKQKYIKFFFLIKRYLTTEKDLKTIEQKWKVHIPFRKGDLNKVLGF